MGEHAILSSKNFILRRDRLTVVHIRVRLRNVQQVANLRDAFQLVMALGVAELL